MKKVVYNAATLGLNAVTTAAPRTSEPFDITFAERFAVHVSYADGGGGTTKVKCQIQFCENSLADIAGGTANWTKDQTQTISGGTITIATASVDKTVAATGADDSDGWNFEVTSACHRAARLVFTFDAGNASDTISVRVVAANYN